MAVDHRATVIDRSLSTAWLEDGLTFAGWVIGTYLLSMLAWVLLPIVLFGWTPLVVVSGSMQPAIRAGDVVLVEPVDHIVGPGTVIAYDAGSGTVLHRVVEVDESGAYTTKGDANTAPDSTPVLGEEVTGQGRLVVPYLGLAKVAGPAWWVALAGLGAAAVPLWRRGSGVAVAAVVGLLGIAGLAAALAAFVASTASQGSALESVDLAAPTAMTATCGPVGVGDVTVGLSWTPSPSSGADGFQIYHDAPAAGTAFSLVGTVPAGQSTFDHVIPVAILGLGTHTYMVRAYAGSWASPDSNTDAVSVVQAGGYVCTDL